MGTCFQSPKLGLQVLGITYTSDCQYLHIRWQVLLQVPRGRASACWDTHHSDITQVLCGNRLRQSAQTNRCLRTSNALRHE
jgi:hypothetical protein